VILPRAAELPGRFGLGAKRADYPDRLSAGQLPGRREIVEQAPPDRLFSEPSDQQTQRFPRRIADAARM
jgi:hypothetical protein